MSHAAAHSAATFAGNRCGVCNGPNELATLTAAAVLLIRLLMLGPYAVHTTGCPLSRLVAAVVPIFTQ